MAKSKLSDKQVEQVALEVTKKNEPTKYRDERGVRKQAYRRFKEDVDYLPIDPDEMVTMLEFEKNNCKRLGRPPVFSCVEELQGAIEAFWDYLINANKNGNALIPDVEGLASFLGVSRDTLNEWERINFRGFAATIKSTKNSIASCKKQLALHGKIPTIVFATDFNNNHGYIQGAQRLEVTQVETEPLMSVEEIKSKYSDLLEE